MPGSSKAGSAVTISVDATARVVAHRVCTDACTDQAEACGMTDRSSDAQESLSADQGGAEAADHHSYSKLSGFCTP